MTLRITGLTNRKPVLSSPFDLHIARFTWGHRRTARILSVMANVLYVRLTRPVIA
jgi:hypothetical protein